MGTKRFQNIKRDFRFLRKKLKGSELQIVFSSAFLVRQWDSSGLKQVDGVKTGCKTVPCLGLLSLWSGMCLGETGHVGTRYGAPGQAG